MQKLKNQPKRNLLLLLESAQDLANRMKQELAVQQKISCDDDFDQQLQNIRQNLSNAEPADWNKKILKLKNLVADFTDLNDKDKEREQYPPQQRQKQ